MAPPDSSRLTLTREISRSGIAAVWEAYDASLDRKVLVKSIHPQYAQESDLRVRFEREARAIARLSHPNVVQVYDLRATDTELSIILEYVEGVSLGKLLKEHGALPGEMAVTIATEILAGLDQAHAAGIIHRDLKPDNVLVSHRGEVKITDFGLASLQDQPTVTQDGMVVGTPSYMAPEQATGGDLTAATDLFACGLIVFEMLTGSRLIEGASLGAAFQSALRYTYPPLEAHREAIPADVEPVLRKLLERQPERRYTSAAEARAALAATQSEGLLPRALIADFLTGGSVHRTTVVRPVRRARSRPLHTMLAVMVAAALSVAGYYVLKPAGPAPDTPADTTEVETGPVAVDPVIVPPVREGVSDEPPARTRIDTLAAANVPRRETPRPELVAPGELAAIDISTRPWASVYVHDSLVGTTPLDAPLRVPPGEYELVLLNPEIGFPVMRTVSARSGETVAVRANLYESVARIRIASVKPWADVYVDGRLETRTPSSRIIFRPLGSHTITLRHPDYPEYTTEVSFRQNDPVYEIRVDLTQL